MILSKNGWIKTIKGHQDDYTNVKYKEGDAEKFIIKLKMTFLKWDVVSKIWIDLLVLSMYNRWRISDRPQKYIL